MQLPAAPPGGPLEALFQPRLKARLPPRSMDGPTYVPCADLVLEDSVLVLAGSEGHLRILEREGPKLLLDQGGLLPEVSDLAGFSRQRAFALVTKWGHFEVRDLSGALLEEGELVEPGLAKEQGESPGGFGVGVSPEERFLVFRSKEHGLFVRDLAEGRTFSPYSGEAEVLDASFALGDRWLYLLVDSKQIWKFDLLGADPPEKVYLAPKPLRSFRYLGKDVWVFGTELEEVYAGDFTGQVLWRFGPIESDRGRRIELDRENDNARTEAAGEGAKGPWLDQLRALPQKGRVALKTRHSRVLLLDREGGEIERIQVARDITRGLGIGRREEDLFLVSGNVVHFFETRTGRARTPVDGHPSRVESIRIPARAHLGYSSDRGGNLLQWDLESLREVSAEYQVRGGSFALQTRRDKVLGHAYRWNPTGALYRTDLPFYPQRPLRPDPPEGPDPPGPLSFVGKDLVLGVGPQIEVFRARPRNSPTRFEHRVTALEGIEARASVLVGLESGEVREVGLAPRESKNTWRGQLGPITRIQLDPVDTGRFYAGSRDATVFLYAFDSPEPRLRFGVTEFDGNGVFAVGPEGNWLALGTREGRVRFYDGRTAKKLGTFQSGSREVTALAFSPREPSLYVGGVEGRIELWELPPELAASGKN